MRRSRSLILAVAAAVAAGGSAVWIASSANAATTPTAAFSKVSDWGSGWQGQYTITNGGSSTLTSWKVEFDLPSGSSVGSYWDALLTSSGQHFTFTNRNYNGTIAPGASVSFGFLGSGSGSPTGCKLNGASCTGGSTPSPTTPTPTATTPTPTPTATTPKPPTPTATTPTPTPTATTPPPNTGLPKHALIGYLHASFANGSGYVKVADIPNEWDVINLSFGEATSATSGDIRFTRCPATECAGVESDADFIAAIRAKQALGKKFLISIGGANGVVQLTTAGARDKFVSSVSAIIDKYGLDGVDIDFEGHSLSLNTGDTDFKNPTTPVIVNLIAALKSLKAKYGAKFVLTMAPETFFVQLGYQFYGSGPWGGQDPRAGSYLPVIYAVRDFLTILHVQDYNSGSIMGLDNQWHSMGGADFHIAMTDMMLAGFPVAGNTANMFPALREDQVAFGAPSSVSAGNGHVGPAGIQDAVRCLVKGTNCGGYTPRSGTNPNFRGLMTWSINWDKFYGWEFKNSHKPFLNGLG
jgi:chitinase